MLARSVSEAVRAVGTQPILRLGWGASESPSCAKGGVYRPNRAQIRTMAMQTVGFAPENTVDLRNRGPAAKVFSAAERGTSGTREVPRPWTGRGIRGSRQGGQIKW